MLRNAVAQCSPSCKPSCGQLRIELCGRGDGRLADPERRSGGADDGGNRGSLVDVKAERDVHQNTPVLREWNSLSI